MYSPTRRRERPTPSTLGPMSRSLAALALLLSLSVAHAGKWTYGGRVGLSQNGSTVVPAAAVSAEYAINTRLSWRTDLELKFRDITRLDTFALTVPTQLLWHPLGNKATFDPYVGPGVSIALDFERKFTAGTHAVAGFSIRPRNGQVFGLEAKWGWPDVFRTDAPAWGLALTGNWNVNFGNR